jgi:hypothetical protein
MPPLAEPGRARMPAGALTAPGASAGLLFPGAEWVEYDRRPHSCRVLRPGGVRVADDASPHPAEIARLRSYQGRPAARPARSPCCRSAQAGLTVTRTS